MVNIAFTEEDIDRLYEEQLSHERQSARKKLLAVYLKSIGVEHAMICKICRVSWPTMLSYIKEYIDGGIEGLTQNLHIGHPSALNAYSQEIKAAFESDPPATIKEARAKILEITGLTRSITQIWNFLNKIGMKPRKVGGVPGRMDVEAQETFKKTS